MEKQSLDNKKKAFIVIFPIVTLILCYALYQVVFNKNKGEEVAITTSEALPVPEVKGDKELSSKWDVYDRKDSTVSAEERQAAMKGYDDFFSEPSKKPEPMPMEETPNHSSNINMELLEEEPSPKAKSNKTEFFEEKPKSATVSRPVVNAKPSSTVKVAPKSNPNKFTFSDEQKKEISGISSVPEKTVSPNSKEQTEDEEKPVEKRRSFYSASTNTESSSGKKKFVSSETDEMINVVIHNDQQVKSGGTVRLRITKDCVVNGVSVPKNTPVSGTAGLGQERLNIIVKSIKLGDQIVRCNLVAYEMDGIAGVYAPGSVNQEIAQQSAQNGTGSVSSSISVPLMGTVSFGAKKKLADPTVKLISGYKLLLKNNEN